LDSQAQGGWAGSCIRWQDKWDGPGQAGSIHDRYDIPLLMMAVVVQLFTASKDGM